MSKPPPGNYYIVNKATTPDGKSLAINFNGKGALLTVTALEKLPTQVWTVSNYNSETQFISPDGDVDLQTTFKDSDNLTVANAGGYVWSIRRNDNIYTVQDGALVTFWSLKEAAVGETVYCGAGTGDEKEYWEFITA